jgi:hypothetical protein
MPHRGLDLCRLTSRGPRQEQLIKHARNHGSEFEQLKRQDGETGEHHVGHEEVARVGQRGGELVEHFHRRLGDVAQQGDGRRRDLV